MNGVFNQAFLDEEYDSDTRPFILGPDVAYNTGREERRIIATYSRQMERSADASPTSHPLHFSPS
jgi:hypothetical protein